MDDSMPVGVIECAGNLPDHRQRLGGVDGPGPIHVRPQRFAGDERHDVEEVPVRLTGIEQRQDVGMLQPGRRPDLVQEPLRSHRGGNVIAHHFDRDLSAVPQVVRQIDPRHAASAERALKFISPAERGR
jgi:hypothetical protein